jgi:hypothetical protein
MSNGWIKLFRKVRDQYVRNASYEIRDTRRLRALPAASSL